MTNDKTSTAGSTISKISDVVTGAAGDHSGLTSLLSAYFLSTGKDALATKAKKAGIDAELKSWFGEDLPHETSAETVAALVPNPVLDNFASETGLTRSATIQALQEQLPKTIHKLREQDEFTKT